MLTCIRMYLFIYLPVYVCVRDTAACIFICTYACVYVCLLVCMYTCIFVFSLFMSVLMYACILVYSRVYMLVCMMWLCVYMHVLHPLYYCTYPERPSFFLYIWFTPSPLKMLFPLVPQNSPLLLPPCSAPTTHLYLTVN